MEKGQALPEERKVRNGELMAAGFFLNYVFRVMDKEWREDMYQETAWFFEHDKRNLKLIRSALDRLIAENDWRQALRREKNRKIQKESRQESKHGDTQLSQEIKH